MKRPQTIDEISALRAEATRAGVTIGICGSASCVPPSADNSVVSTQRLNRILDCDPAAGLVRVEAGISIDALQQQLMFRGRWLGVDAAAPNARSPIHRTIGGLLSTDSAGLLRGLRGGWKRVVRAASGIDRHGTRHDSIPLQPLIGSANTAIPAALQPDTAPHNDWWIIEVTLQIVPPPADERALLFFCERLDEARSAAHALRQLPVRPGYAGLINRAVLQHNRLQLPPTRYAVIAGFLGTRELTIERAETLRQTLGGSTGETLLLSPAQSGRLRHWIGSEPAGNASLSVQSSDPIATVLALEAVDPDCWLVADLLENRLRGTLNVSAALGRAYLTRGETVHRLVDNPAPTPSFGDP